MEQIQQECVFREHPAEVTLCPPEIPGVTVWQFGCQECAAKYEISQDLLDHDGKSLRHAGEMLSRLARRLWAEGDILKLVTELDVAKWSSEQARFE
jgi:hypothetical protein